MKNILVKYIILKKNISMNFLLQIISELKNNISLLKLTIKYFFSGADAFVLLTYTHTNCIVFFFGYSSCILIRLLFSVNILRSFVNFDMTVLINSEMTIKRIGKNVKFCRVESGICGYG